MAPPRQAANFSKRIAAAVGLLVASGLAHAGVGLVELPAGHDGGPVTVLFPSSAPPTAERRGAFVVDVAADAAPQRGNGRLVVMSHGSPGSPWPYFDLARALVDLGFVVAMPEHHADNVNDDSDPGPPSWKRRPLEISRAIDRVANDVRFQPLLKVDRVGMYGLSAGGHTALTLAGGRWSPARLRAHCNAHITEDFHACAGPTLTLDGGLLDRLKVLLVRAVINVKLRDTEEHGHTDPRIAAIALGVPFAADFDLASLSEPAMPVAIITARLDRWLAPAFHSEAVLAACRSCERLADLQTGGHGALLSPLPPARGGLIDRLIGDPPGFDRATIVPEVKLRIAAFFAKHLLGDVAR
jgi:predicted dienelactone hydrolase